MSNERETAAPSASAQRKLPLAVAVIILAVLLIPCILAAVSDTIYPRTSVAGIAVGGMSRSEAETVLTRDLPGAYDSKTLPIIVDNGASGNAEFELPLSQLHITANAAAAAEAAWQNGRSGNFFTSGVAYAKGLLLGHTITPELKTDRAGAEKAIADIAAQADTPVTECNWRIAGDTLYITKPKSGYLIDRSALLAAVEDAVARYDLGGITCTRQERAAAAVTMEELYNDAHREAGTPYYDKATGTVKDGETGVDFDVSEAKARMEAAEAGAEFTVPVTVTRPKITKEDMAKYLFRDKLGACTTNVSGSSNRKHNVSLAAKSCNGVVLNPGEVFSYNSTLGQRTAARGYLPAGAYVNGKTVSEYGGGICQISSTVYLAVLRSNLEIVSRTNHMFYPGYIPFGMDATVSWGGPDLKFRNNTDYPIKLVVSYSGGKATCTVYGTNLAGTSVKMEYNILSTTSYETVEKEDASLAPGTSREEQNGYTGYKIASYRCVYDKDGNLISRKLEANSTYKSRNRIVLVGPAKAATPATPTEPSAPAETPAAPETPVTPATPETPVIPEIPVTPETPPEGTGSETAGSGGSSSAVQPDTGTGATWESPRAS